MLKVKFHQKLRYKFDNFIAKGGGSIFLSLIIVFIIAIIIIGGIRVLFFQLNPAGVTDPGLSSLTKSIWGVFVQFTDPGTMYYDNDSSGAFKTIAVISGLSGVVMMSMVIAVLTTALDQKLAFLRKGHSKVIENDHTLILGWNERVIEILRELILANESERNPSVVIMSEEEKEFMDDHLGNTLKEKTNTRIISRSGNTASLGDLERVSVDSCRSVIVLANCGDSADAELKAASDAKVIKSVLAIDASRNEDSDFHIVAEIFEETNRQIVESIAPDNITTVNTLDILAKILVQTSRSSGLAVVYSELLSFDGCEMYFHNATWNNARFGDIQYHFPDGVPIGVRTADGAVKVNPPADIILNDDDDILIIADDDSTIKFKKRAVAKPTEYPLSTARLEAKQEKNLLIGWNSKAPIFITELADYVRDDSVVDIVLHKPSNKLRQEIEALQADLSSIKINLIDLDPFKKVTLESLEPYSYNDIIILSQSGGSTDPERTDSETIIILLLLRQILAEHPSKIDDLQLITEVMNSENQDLISKAGVNDFIISNRFVSNILAQISEEADIKDVYDDLFEEDGSEIYLKPVHLYFDTLPDEVIFADLMAIAQKREEICIGVRIGADSADLEANFGVELIPEKKEKYKLTKDDFLVVVAEDEL